MFANRYDDFRGARSVDVQSERRFRETPIDLSMLSGQQPFSVAAKI